MTSNELVERILANDEHIIGRQTYELILKLQTLTSTLFPGNLMLMGASLPGSKAFWSYQERKAVALEQWLEFYSQSTEAFNIFLTFTLPDLHLEELHRLLPGSEAYLHKIVVQSVADIPPGADANNYITKRQDYQLRQAAVQANGHLVTEFAQLRMQELMEVVLGPQFGLTEFLVRTEFGTDARRCPHFHIVARLETDMRPDDFVEACRVLFMVEDSRLEGEALEAAKQAAVKAGVPVVESGGELPPDIAQARQRVGHAAVGSMGISNIHPNPQHVVAGDVNVLRTPFSPTGHLDQELAQLVDRVQTHTCSPKCLRLDTGTGLMMCVAGYPRPLTGYTINNAGHIERSADDYQEGFEFVPTTDNSSGGWKTSKLELLRNHPTVVSHNPELLLIWRGVFEIS